MANCEKTKQKSKEAYARFVHGLLLKWLEMKETGEKKKRLSSVEVHLKELSTEQETGPTIVAYLSSQMQ